MLRNSVGLAVLVLFVSASLCYMSIYARNEAYNRDITTHVNYEFDFLFTSKGKAYFIIVMYGIEYVINIIDPCISDYVEWLKNNEYICPLYISLEQRKKEFNGYYKFYNANHTE